MHNQTRKLTEGAMMVALVGVMLFINRQFANMIEYVMYWILTFPILIYTVKYGVRYGILTSFCMLLISFMTSSFTTMFYLVCCIIVGIVYGEGVRRNWKNGTLLLFVGMVTVISYIITTVVFAAFFGYDPGDDVQMVQTLVDVLHIDVHFIHMDVLVPCLVVIVAVVMSILQTICIHLGAKLLLKRLHIKTRKMKSLFDFSIRPVWGIVIIIIWILFSMRNVLKLNQEVSIIVLVVYLCTFIIALSYGALTCVIGSIMIQKKGFVFLVMIAVCIPYVQTGIALIGILDILLSLRKQMKRGVVHG